MKKYLYSVQSFSADATILKKIFFASENKKKKLPQKLLIIGPHFFSVLAWLPKPAQN